MYRLLLFLAAMLGSVASATGPIGSGIPSTPLVQTGLIAEEIYQLEIKDESGQVIMNRPVQADHRGMLHIRDLMQETGFYQDLYDLDRPAPTTQWLDIRISHGDIELDRFHLSMDEFHQINDRPEPSQIRSKAWFLPDPALWKPYECTPNFYLNKTDNTYGNIYSRVFYPSESVCYDPPPQGSPLAVIFNGQGYFSRDYDYLGYHLAGNGFVVLVVATSPPQPTIHCGNLSFNCIEDRARMGVSMIHHLKDTWQHANRVDWNNVSVIGHSQGGEAAVEVASIIRAEEPELGSPGVRAVISLAPTDMGVDGVHSFRRLKGRDASNYLVIYGGYDEQIKGGGWYDKAIENGNEGVVDPPARPYHTGFDLYDRAGTQNTLDTFPLNRDDLVEKAMKFIDTANHEQFSDRYGTPINCYFNVMDADKQRKIAKGLVNAWLMWRVWGWNDYKPYFDGTMQFIWGELLWPQFSEGVAWSRRTVDNFEDGEELSNVLGGNVVFNPNRLDVDVLDLEDTPYSFMHGEGHYMRLSYDQASISNTLRFHLPLDKQNISQYTHLSLRIGLNQYVEGSGQFKVRLKSDSWGVQVSSADYGLIPQGIENKQECNTNNDPFVLVSHMRTIRIPLADFNNDLNNIQFIQFRFDHADGEGLEYFIDNIEFAGKAN